MLDIKTGPRRGAGFLGFSILFLLSLPLRAGAYEGDPLTNAVRDLGYVQDAPARLNERPEALLAGGLLAAGALIYASDEGIRRVFRVNRTDILDNASAEAEKIGNGWYPHAVFLGLCGGAGVALRDGKLRDTTLEAAEAFLAANAVGSVVKYAAGRSRPYLEDGKRSFRPFSFKASRSSFPSGHATSAFAIASVFASRYRSFWVRGLMYGGASAVGVQRVYADRHWASDVFAGAVLGTVTGLAVVRFSEGRGKGEARVVPVYGEEMTGALVSVPF